MSKKMMTSMVYIGLGIVLFFGIVSCEKDFEDIAIDLVDNDKFSVGDSIFEIIAYNFNVEKSRVDNNDFNKQPLSLLGVNKNEDFGYLKAALISQLSLPGTPVDFGSNPSIDKVVLDIPYLVKDTVVIKEINLIICRSFLSLMPMKERMVRIPMVNLYIGFWKQMLLCTGKSRHRYSMFLSIWRKREH